MEEEIQCKLPRGVHVECSLSQKRLVVQYLMSTNCRNPQCYNGSGDGPVGLSFEGNIEYSNKCEYSTIITYEEFEKLISEPLQNKEIINTYSIY